MLRLGMAHSSAKRRGRLLARLALRLRRPELVFHHSEVSVDGAQHSQAQGLGLTHSAAEVLDLSAAVVLEWVRCWVVRSLGLCLLLVGRLFLPLLVLVVRGFPA